MSSGAESALGVVLALAVGFAWYERGRPPSKLVAMVAALAALAVAGRVIFVPIPNVQATTDVVLLSGCALGAAPGFAVGAVAAFASNFFLGQGPWTPWQMLGWGAVGIGGGLLAPVLVRNGAPGRRFGMTVACAAAGLAFGAWMDLFTLETFSAERTPSTYVAIASVSAPFNIAHALGNVVLCLLFGPGFLRTLLRFKQRFSVEWRPGVATAPAGRVPGTAASLVVLSLVTLAALAFTAQAAPRVAPGLRYLELAQGRDGGFGAAPGQQSNQLMTGWAAIGLEAAGARSVEARTSARRAVSFMRRRTQELNDTGEIERTILAVRGAGLSVRTFAGRDLLAELLGRRRPDGSFNHQVNLTAFGVLALRAGGSSRSSPAVRRAASWLARQRNADGGFSFAERGGASDADDTGASLQALAAAGVGAKGVRPVLAYLRGAQNLDGGFGQFKGSRSNAQSTAWAVQGIFAAGGHPRAFHRRGSRSPVAYLESLQQHDGSFRYSRTSVQTPVWVTAQAIAALSGNPLPLRAPPRVRRAARAAVTRATRAGRRSRGRGGAGPRVHSASRRSRHRPSRLPATARRSGMLAKSYSRPAHRPRPRDKAPIWPWLAGAAPVGVAALWLGRRLSRHS